MCIGSERLITAVSKVKSVWGVYVTVDKVDVGLKAMLIHDVADMVPLQLLPPEEGSMSPYPRLDYGEWLGAKVPVFAVRSPRLSEVVLQMDVVKANAILEETAQYILETKGVSMFYRTYGVFKAIIFHCYLFLIDG
jgi:hypothetical protein